MALNWDKISTQSNSNNSQPKKTSLNWDKINIEQATPIAKAQAMPISEQVTNPANILQNATKIQTYNDVAPVETVPTTQAQKNQALIKDLEAKGYKINYATPETKQKALAGEINTQLATKEDYARMANERPNMLEDTGKTIGYNAVAGMANIIDAGYAGGTKLAGLDASTINAENLIRYNKGDTGGFLENTGKTVLDIAGRANPIYGLLRNPMGLGQTVNDSYKKLEQIHKLYPNNTKLNNLYTQITQGTYKGTQEELEKTLSEIQTEIAKGFKAKYTDDDRKRVARQAEINKENYGTAGDIILNKGIGTASQMAPVALASVAFGPAAGTTAIGLQAGGGAYNQALDEGASFDEAFNYGVLSGAAEATIEKISGDAVNKFLLGGKGKTVTGGWVDDFIKSKGINNTFAKVALTTVNDIGGEAVEEGISAAVEPLIAEITYNPDREFNLKEYGASIVTAMIDSIPATLFMGGAGKVQTINAVNKYETGLINEINKSTLTDTQKAELIKGVQEKCADARIGLETNFDEIQAEVAENLQNATQTENVPQNNVENAQNMQESVQSDTKQRLAQILKQAEKEAESNFQPTVKIELINEIKGISKQQASKMDEFPAYQLAKKIYKANAIKKNKNIIVSNRDIKEHINKVIHNNSQRALMKEHLMLLSKLDDIISNGKKVNFSSDEKLRSKYKNWNYYISQTTIDGKPFIAEYELASKEDGVHFRLLRLKKVAHAQTSDQSNTDTAFVSLATSDSLTQTRNYVNNLLPTTEQLQAQDQKQAEEAYNTLNMKKQEDGLKEAIDSISKNENANKVSYTNDFYRNIRTALGEKAGKELTAIFDTQK